MWAIVTTIVCTALFISMFGKVLGNIENFITEKFSAATSTKRWFSIWVLVFALWISLHKQLLGHVKWYNEDIDLIVLTGLFSAVPFWVENSLKYGQAKFQEILLALLNQNTEMLQKLTDLTIALDAQQELMYVLVEKIVNALEVPKP